MSVKKPMSTGRKVLTIITGIVGIIILALALCLGVPYYFLQAKYRIKESPAPAASEVTVSSTDASE